MTPRPLGSDVATTGEACFFGPGTLADCCGCLVGLAADGDSVSDSDELVALTEGPSLVVLLFGENKLGLKCKKCRYWMDCEKWFEK